VKDPQERFRCKVGHAFTAESLAEAQKDEVERALWTAYRVLIERARHLDRMAARFRDRSMNLAQEYSRRAEEAERNAASVQRLLTGE
jgi:two-component system chemotaxis response regulator CheB